MNNNLLDVIVIGKNEEKSLEKTFISVLKSTSIFEDKLNTKVNIIYVDSKSTDNSIKIAEKFNIKTFSVTGKCTAGIARNLGSEKTKSKYIFFLDGDTQVDENWLVKGVRFLDENNLIAGVGGKLNYFIYNINNEIIWSNDNYWGTKKNEENIYDGVGGTFLYKREEFKKSGGFSNSYKISEEFDLMLRVLSLNKKVVRLNTPMAIHDDFKVQETNFILRHLLTKDIFIPGVVCRNSPKNKISLNVIIRRYWLTVLHLPILIMAICLSLVDWRISIFIFTLLFIFHLKYKKFNPIRGLISIFTMNFYSLGFYIGFIKG